MKLTGRTSKIYKTSECGKLGDEKSGTGMIQKELWVNTDFGSEKGTFEFVYGTNCLRLVMDLGAGSCVNAPQNGANEGRSIYLWGNAI